MSKKKPKNQGEELRTAPPPEAEGPPPDPVADTITWLLEGNVPEDVLVAAAEHFPGLDPADLVTQALARLVERFDIDPEHRLAWHVEARRELYRRSLDINDYKTAHTILKELADLDGTGARARGRTPTHPEPTNEADGVPSGDGLTIPEVQ